MHHFVSFVDWGGFFEKVIDTDRIQVEMKSHEGMNRQLVLRSVPRTDSSSAGLNRCLRVLFK